ncbi:hypothetical protein P22_3491 [Propionispora sp. 2/2-37]|uniref:DEAD/DEAH box helicase n=1 Tax=Propionispora sp. 2/2-37 TaxID=1677858 RepID=UPI0006BB7868|nr:DEAD/DEAH box helicase [Propionispora sp. 2/2-37]CUH97363.1 hypothetical protein P22_3491 [Propionispora sp. 2/2-37]
MEDFFYGLGITEPLVRALQQENITVPTDIQKQVIPPALAGKDIIGQSATGTGKTLAYLLPLIQRLDTAKRETQVLILSPTHELAIQIHRQIELVTNRAGLPVVSAPIIGNVNISRQIDKLKETPHMIVGSSGRILELIQKRKIVAQTVKSIVLDEADRLLDDQNIDSVKNVIKTTLRDRQLLLFSATFSRTVQTRIKELLKDPVVVQVKAQAKVPADIEHFYFVAERRDKIEVLRKLTFHMNVKRALVFINQGDQVGVVTEKLNYHGFNAVGLHGGSLKNERKKAIEDFRNGKARLLVASDLAARGLDIAGVRHVFNLDLPEEAEIYLHRVGRTGRSGQKGTAISLVTAGEIQRLKKFAQALRVTVIAKKLLKGKILDAADRDRGPVK